MTAELTATATPADDACAATSMIDLALREDAQGILASVSAR
jgi:hypothetical protein